MAAAISYRRPLYTRTGYALSEKQLTIGAAAKEPSEHRVRALAGVLAGFGWPGRESFERLTKPQRARALEAAREALRQLETED